jgi:hypothetical protein
MLPVNPSMRYFDACKIGQERTDRAAKLLASVSGYAKSAVFLKHETNEFEPVGEENFYAIIPLKPPSVVVVLCDSGGNSKAMSQFFTPKSAESVAKKLEALGIRLYTGEPYLPL